MTRTRISQSSAHQMSLLSLGRMVHPPTSDTSDDHDDVHNSMSGYEGLNEHQIALKKQEWQKIRKARNQRRYYRRCVITLGLPKLALLIHPLGRNKAEQQAKGRERAAKYVQSPRQSQWYLINVSFATFGTFCRNRALSAATARVASRGVEGEVDGQSSHEFTLVPVNSGFSMDNGSLASTFRVQSFDDSPPLPAINTIGHGGDPDSTNTLHEDQNYEMIEFLKHDVRGRLAFIRRMLLNLEPDWGTVDRWPMMFTRDWACVKGGGNEVVYNWFSKVRKLSRNGQRAITYVN